MRQPFLFTIGIPAYNAEYYLEECLKSLERQSQKDFEVILIDDGSRDRTGIICDNFKKKSFNTLVIHKSNQGVLSARKDIIEKARGEYIIFLDSDDCLRFDTVAECAKIAKKENYPDIIVFDYSTIQDFSSSNSTTTLQPGLHKKSEINSLRKALCSGELNSVCFKAIKTDILKPTTEQLPKLIYSEDFYQMILVLAESLSLYYLKFPLYFYRQNDQSNTKNFHLQYLFDLKITLSKLLTAGDLWNLKKEAEKGALLQICYLASILVSDTSIKPACKKAHLDEIKKTILELQISKQSINTLRFDLRIIIRSLVKGNKHLAKIILHLHLVLRSLLHRI